MKKNNCNIIKDIIPLYIDDIVSDDTREFVEEHLEHCSNCRKEVAILQKNINWESENELHLQEAQTLKAFKKKWRNNKILIAGGSAILTIVILLSLFCTFVLGTKANSKDIIVTTEFQQVGDSYEYYQNKEWVIHLKHDSGKALRVKNEYVYDTDENGNKIETGCIISLYEVQPTSFIMESDNYTFGYWYNDTNAPTSDFDYTITVRYKDKDVVYSMI
jgi:putative zinc finger protein